MLFITKKPVTKTYSSNTHDRYSIVYCGGESCSNCVHMSVRRTVLMRADGETKHITLSVAGKLS